MKAKTKLAFSLIALAGLLIIPLSGVLWLPAALGAEDKAAMAVLMESEIWAWGLIGAALATGLSSLGAGYAVASVGTAAIGAIAEKPELFGRVMVFVGLAEGIAIYGLIISILILNRLV